MKSVLQIAGGFVVGYVVFKLLLASMSANAWDGYDWDSGSYVEIGSGELVREGRTVEIYDWNTGDYHDVDIYDIRETFTGVELEVYDWETGEYRYLDMDD